MSLSKCKGLLRASLCLAIGYLEHDDLQNKDKCKEVVSKYLHNNGMKFDFTQCHNKAVIETIVNIASDVVSKNLPIESALLVLSNELGINVNY